MLNSFREKLEESLQDLTIDDKGEEEKKRLRIEKEKEEAKRNVEAQRGILGKAQDLIDGGKHREELQAVEFSRLDKIAEEQEKKKREAGLSGLIDNQKAEFQSKIADFAQQDTGVSGASGTTANAGKLEKQDQEHLSEKVYDLWHRAPPGESQAQEEHEGLFKDVKGVEETFGKTGNDGWREKLTTLALGGHQVEKKQVERGWLKEQLNEMAGGGVKSEANEDVLDKTIDFVQQYILREGQQSDESALEQMKDKEIKEVIRLSFKQVTGHELPIGNK